MSLRSICAGAAFLGMAAAQDGAPCFTEGSAYNGTSFSAPNGGFPANALGCQTLCQQQSLTCSYFTWYSNSKACWLQGPNVTVFDAVNATSGPVQCDNTTVSDASAQERDIGKKTESGGFPVWLAVILALALVALCFGCFYYYFTRSSGGSDKKKKKTSKEPDSESEGKQTATDIESQAPLIGTETEGSPPAVNAITAPAYTMTGQLPSPRAQMMTISGAPLAQQFTISGAPPAQYFSATSVAPTPQYYTEAPQYYTEAPQYYTEAPQYGGSTSVAPVPVQYIVSGGAPAQYAPPAQYTVSGAY